MPNPPEGYPLAAAISPRVQVVETTDSTNADVVRHVTEAPAEWPHLSLLLTTDQRAGRGRLDRDVDRAARHRARGLGARPGAPPSRPMRAGGSRWSPAPR